MPRAPTGEANRDFGRDDRTSGVADEEVETAAVCIALAVVAAADAAEESAIGVSEGTESPRTMEWVASMDQTTYHGQSPLGLATLEQARCPRSAQTRIFCTNADAKLVELVVEEIVKARAL